MLSLSLAAPALAQDLVPAAVAVPDGRLVPGTANRIEVAVLGRLDPPEVSGTFGPARLLHEVSTGVWRYALPVAADADEVAVRVTVDGRPFGWTFETWTPPESTLELPRRVDGVAGGEAVVVTVTGEDLPPTDALQVVLGEGRVTSITPTPRGIELAIEPEDSPFPRYIPVGIRDRRTGERPTWGQIRLRARPSLPLESEPGSTATVSIGSRDYGPLTVGPEGRIDVRVDQYPEEIVASVRFVDDLGNETRQEIPLAREGGTQLVALASGDLFPGESGPVLHLAGFQTSGFPWRGAAPACRSATADLEVLELSRGQWMVPLGPVGSQDVDDLRVDCSLSDGASRRIRVPVVQGVPARLGLRVWPTELRTDFPFAEVRVVLEDHRGERLDVEGVAVSADHGAVALTAVGRTQVQGEYDGTAAAERQRDRVVASWRAPAGEGHVDVLQMGWERLPDGGEATVRVRVLDALRRPLQGARVEIDGAEGPIGALTDDRGVATARVPVPLGAGPLVLVARSGGREAQAVGIRGLPGRDVASFELGESVDVTLNPGRVAGVSVRVDPQVLRAAPGAVAFVYVDVEDRSGNRIPDEDIRLTASEGLLGSLRTRPDGSRVAEYVPVPSDRPREVQITAEVDTLRSSTRLEIAPRPVRLTLGAWAGVQSNFGSVLAPVVVLDGDLRVRTRLAGELLMLRLGVARYHFSQRVITDLGPPALLASTVYPVTAAGLLRQERGRFAVWGGGGGVLAIQDLSVGFGDADLGSGIRVLGGPAAVGGAGVRALGGEFLLAVQASWLPSGRQVGFSGNIGGLGSGLGYRLVF